MVKGGVGEDLVVWGEGDNGVGNVFGQLQGVFVGWLVIFEIVQNNGDFG